MKPSNYFVILHSGVSKILGKTLLAFVQHEQKTVKKRLISDYLATIQQLFHAKMLATIKKNHATIAEKPATMRLFHRKSQEKP